MVTIEKSKLIDALNRVRHTVADSKMIRQLLCFCFSNGEIRTYSGHSGTVVKLDLGGMDFCVNAERFWKLSNSLFDSIELKLAGGNLHIKSGSFTGRIGTIPTKGFPSVVQPQISMYYDGGGLTNALSLLEFTVGANAQKPELLGICMEGDYAYSSDGKRVTRLKLPKAVGSNISIPASACKNIQKLGEPARLFLSGGCVGASYPDTNTTFVANLLASRFPVSTIDGILSTPESSFVHTFPANLADIINRVTLMATDSEPDIVMESTGTSLIVSGSEQTVGEASEECLWDFTHPFKLKVKSNYILSALEKTRRVDFGDVCAGGQNRRLRFKEDNFDHVLSLMML